MELGDRPAASAEQVTCLGDVPLRFSDSVWDRNATLYSGPGGLAEASPLPGYFDDARACHEAAIATVARPWPVPRRDAIAVNALIPSGPLEEATARALHAHAGGVTCFKIKVIDPHDVERIAAMRTALGPAARLRVDSNARWSLAQAREFLREVRQFDIEYIEDPVDTLEACAALRAEQIVPVAVDMLVRDRAEADRAQRLHAADVLVLKVQALGGLHAAYEIGEAFEGDVVVSSMMESSVGIHVGLALACALTRAPLACGLGTAEFIQSDVVASPLLPSGGVLSLADARMELITNSNTRTANANGCSI